MAQETFGLDAPRVTQDEAVELCIHHLQLANMYFEAVPDDEGEQLKEEAKRRMCDGKFTATGYLAILAYVDRIVWEYEQLKKDDA